MPPVWPPSGTLYSLRMKITSVSIYFFSQIPALKVHNVNNSCHSVLNSSVLLWKQPLQHRTSYEGLAGMVQAWSLPLHMQWLEG